MKDLKIVINGAGASGIAIAKLLFSSGVVNMILCDTKGAIYSGRPVGMNPAKESVATFTNGENEKVHCVMLLKERTYLLEFLSQVP